MRSLLALLALPLLVSAASPEAVPPCPGVAAPLPASLAAWQAGPVVTAASDGAALRLNTRTAVTLAEAAAVHYLLPPEHPGAAGSRGGVLTFTVTRAGTYRIALGAAAWVDVVQGGKAVASVAHDHGPACSGIRKLVDFVLTPGSYALQLSGSSAPTLAMLVTPLP